MNREIDGRKPELNDAALEGVSGGAGDAPYVHYHNQQQKVCHECPSFRDSQCGKDLDLRAYLQQNGPDSVKNHIQCPFYEG